MIKPISLIFSALLVFSCNNDSESAPAEICDCEMLAHDNLSNKFFLEDVKKPYSGICKSYHPNGKLKQERELVDGKNNGFFRNFSENGVLIEEGTFLNNRHDGWFKYYDDDGKLTLKIQYKEGIPLSEKAKF